MLLAATGVDAAIVSWDGGGDGVYWHDPVNWDGDIPPGPSDDAAIGYGHSVIFSAGGEIAIQSLQCGGTLEVAMGKLSITLDSVTATLITTQGMLFCDGDLSIPGSLSALGGIISVNSLNGSGTIQIDGGQLQMASDSQINRLVITGGSILYSGVLSVDNSFNWSGGSISAMGSTTNVTNLGPGCITNITGSAGKYVGTHIKNSGTVIWTDGDIYLVAGSITNLSGGIFVAQGNGNRISRGGVDVFRFRNEGTFRNNVGINTIEGGYGSLDFSNTGVIDVQTGKLELLCTGSSSGNINVAGGASLDIAGGTKYGLDAGATFTGDGVIQVLGGAINANADVSMINVSLTNGSLNTDLGGILTITNTLDWSGGVINNITGSGFTTLGSGCTANLTGSAFKHVATHLKNSGTVIWTDGEIRLQGTITNLPGGVFEAQGDGDSITRSYYARFNNEGTFSKTGTGTITLTGILGGLFELKNTGVIDVQTGNLVLQYCTNSSSGNINIAGGTSLDIAGGTDYDLNAGATFTGDGLIQVLGGKVNANADVSMINVSLTNGSLNTDLGGKLTITNTLNWSGGVMSNITGPGFTTLGSGCTANLTGSAFKHVSTHLKNSGTVIWTDGEIRLQGTITNLPGGVFEAQGDGDSITRSYYARFNNEGTFSKTGTGTITLTGILGGLFELKNTGVIDVQTGNLVLQYCTNSSSGNINIAGGTSLDIAGGTDYDLNAGATFTGDGLIQVLGGKVNANADVSMINVSLTNGSLNTDLGGKLTITNTLNWSGGVMSNITGPGFTTLGSGCTANLTGSAFKHVSTHLKNSGTVIWTDGEIRLQGTITNLPGGVFEAQGDGDSISRVYYARFNNEGTFRRTTGAGTITMRGNPGDIFEFSNTGAVDVQTGNLVLHCCTGSSSGNINIAGGTSLDITGGTDYDFDAGATFTGDGLIQVLNGKVNANADVSMINVSLTKDSLNTDLGGELTITNTLDWSGGVISNITGSGFTNIGSGCTANITGSEIKYVSTRLSNSGTVIWTDGEIYLHGTITNLPGGVFEAQGDGDSISRVYYARFNNEGTFRRTTGAGTITMRGNPGDIFEFSNTGAVDVQTGNLVLHCCTGSSSGNINIAGGTSLDITGGTDYDFDAGATFTGDGLIQVLNGKVNANADVSMINVSLTKGSLNTDLGGELTITNTFDWSGGVISIVPGGSGSTNLGSGCTANITGSDAKYVTSTFLNNSGTVIWTDGEIRLYYGGTINNLPGGVFEAQGDGDSITFAGGASFNNEGTFRRTTGAGTIAIGTGVAFSNSGTVEVLTGTLHVADGYIQTGGSTILSNARLTTKDTIDIQGGTLLGSGDIAGKVNNAAQVKPGLSPGILNIDGDYTQSAAGVLDTEIGGSDPGTEFDQLNVTGHITLGGTLNVLMIGTPTIDVGDTFEIMTYGSGRTGDFAVKTGLDITGLPGTAGVLTPNYDDGNGKLLLVAGEASVFNIGDVTQLETDIGTTNFTFTVTLSPGIANPTSVDYATADGTAIAGSDYVGISTTTLSFAAWETSKSVVVNVYGDTGIEPHERFYVNLSNATGLGVILGDAQGEGTIQNDETAVSIDDVSIVEGDSGTTDFDFTVSLEQPCAVTVTVDYATSDDTATAGSDYVATSGTLTFIPEDTEETITVQVNGETVAELDETFNVDLSDPGPPGDLTITDALGVGAVQNDDATLSIDDVTLPEGDSGTKDFDFTVSIPYPSHLPVSVNFTTADQTATVADSDYQANSGLLTISPGDTSDTAKVLVNGDTRNEDNETFEVILNGATNATITDPLGIGTIENDDSEVVWTNVTDNSDITYFGTRFNRRTGRYSMMAKWTNIGETDPLGEPLHIVIDSITPDTVTCANEDGTNGDEKPYYDYSDLVGDGKLEPGETSAAKQLIFNNPSRVRFSFDVSCWAVVEGGDGAPPMRPRMVQTHRIHVVIPGVSALAQNYPNPFNPDTWIPYELADAGKVSIKIYDIQGRIVRTLDLGHKEIGQYFSKDKAAYWDGRNETGERVASSIYFYQIQAGDFSSIRKMVIVE